MSNRNSEFGDRKHTGFVSVGDYLRGSYVFAANETLASPWRLGASRFMWCDASVKDPVWVCTGLTHLWERTLLNLIPVDSESWQENVAAAFFQDQVEPKTEGEWEILIPDCSGPLFWDDGVSSDSAPSLEELLELLSLRCDFGPASIDPTPLDHLYRSLEAGDWHTPNAVQNDGRLSALFDAAGAVLHRLTRCAEYEHNRTLLDQSSEHAEHARVSHASKTVRRRRSSANEERDEWLYAEAVKGQSLQSLSDRLRADQEDRNWYPLHTRQGVSNAIDRYCKRKGLDRPNVNEL